MRKIVMIEDHPVELNTSAGWFYRYREQFGRDVLPDIMPIVEAVLAGAKELLDTIVAEKNSDRVDAAELAGLMDNDAIVDMFVKLAGMEFVTLFGIFWAMAKNADPKIDPPEKFMNSFDVFPIEEVAPGLLYLIAESSVSSKNSAGLLRTLRDRIPSISTWSRSPESTEG